MLIMIISRSIIIETFIFIHFVKITWIAAAAQNQTTQIVTIKNNDLITNDDDNELINYVTSLFCQLNSNPVYMYIDHEMIFNRNVADMIQAIHGCMRSTIFLKRIYTTKSYIYQHLRTNNKLQFTLFLILNQLSDRPDQQFSFISKFTARKNQKKYIIFINSTNNTVDSFYQLFREFHRKLIYNIVVMVRNETNNFNVMTYNPFAVTNYIEYFDRHESRLSKLFYNKIFRNIHRRMQIKIIIFEEKSRMIVNREAQLISGIDGFMLATIMQSMNADYEIKLPRDNKTYGAYLNGSMYGTLKDIHEWQGDISFNSRFLKPNDYLRIVEPTVVLGRDDLCLLVPNSGNESHIGNLFRAFGYIVWFLIVAMIFFVSTTIYCMQKVIRKTRGRKRHEIKFILLTIFKSNLNQSLRKTPKIFEIRIVFISWLFYCFLLTNTFFANITSVLILEREQKQIDTLDELAQSGLEILTALRYKTEIIRNLNLTKASHKQIERRLTLSDEQDLHELIANNTVDYAYVEKEHMIKYILDRRSHLVNGRRIFHAMQQCPVPNLITYITPIGSPYLDRINFLVRQILESGLYGWWSKTLENERRSNKIRRFIKNAHNSEPFKDLALSHLQLVFYLLAVGLSVATVVFFIERRMAGQPWRTYKFQPSKNKLIKIVYSFIKKIFSRKSN